MCQCTRTRKLKTNAQTSLEVLQEILPVLEAQEDYSNDALYQTLLKYVEQKGCKNGYVMWPIRTAVSGKQMTPAVPPNLWRFLEKKSLLPVSVKGNRAPFSGTVEHSHGRTNEL